MDYMTLATVIEDLDATRNAADIEKLMIKYERTLETIEQQMTEQYDLEMDDGA